MRKRIGNVLFAKFVSYYCGFPSSTASFNRKPNTKKSNNSRKRSEIVYHNQSAIKSKFDCYIITFLWSIRLKSLLFLADNPDIFQGFIVSAVVSTMKFYADNWSKSLLIFIRIEKLFRSYKTWGEVVVVTMICGNLIKKIWFSSNKTSLKRWENIFLIKQKLIILIERFYVT